MKKQCKFGVTCKNWMVGQNCGYLHNNVPNTGASMGGPMGGGMAPTGGGGSRPCNYGTNCNKWKAGKCTFYHDTPYTGIVPEGGGMGGGMGGMGGMGGGMGGMGGMGGGMGGLGGGNSSGMGGGGKNPCHFGTNCNKWKAGKCTYYHDVPFNPNMGMGGGGMGTGGMGTGGMGGMGGMGSMNPNLAEFQSKFCKNWMNERCQNKKCPRLHKFTQDDSLLRTLYNHDAPTHFNSNIVCFKKDGITFLPIKMGDTVYFLAYDPILNQLQNRNFSHKAEHEIMYFKCEQDNLLYSFENPVTKLWTICLYNISNNLLVSIPNAHQKFVTGIVLYNKQTLITTSLDGRIKVWVFDPNKGQFNINVDYTERFQKKIDGNQLTVCKLIEPLHTMAVGSKSGNIILWDLNSLECAQTLVPKYTNIYDIQIKFFKNQGVWVGFVLAWTPDEKKQSAVLQLNTNNLEVMEIASDRETICKILVTDELLLCGSVSGTVYIYRLLPTLAKIGCVLYHNDILDLAYLESVTPTMITYKNIIVLEACKKEIKDERSKGSLSIFRFNE